MGSGSAYCKQSTLCKAKAQPLGLLSGHIRGLCLPRVVLTFLLLFLSGGSLAGSVITVIDGDTFRLNGETVRVLNIDAPEIHPCRCQHECDLGYQARAFAEQFLVGDISLERADRKDKYGRTLARVSVGGRDLGDALIAQGLARPWEGRRRPWC